MSFVDTKYNSGYVKLTVSKIFMGGLRDYTANQMLEDLKKYFECEVFLKDNKHNIVFSIMRPSDPYTGHFLEELMMQKVCMTLYNKHCLVTA